MACCKIEAITAIDERGQMILPKEVRDKAGIKPGDKLAIIAWEKDGQVCCLALIRAEELMPMVKEILNPVVKEIVS